MKTVQSSSLTLILSILGIFFYIGILSSENIYAQYASSRDSRRGSRSNVEHFGLEGGFRWMGHYALTEGIKIPPPSLLTEVQLNTFLSDSFSFHLLFGYGFFPNTALEYGGGVKFRFMSFNTGGGSSALIRAVHLEIVGDVVKYSMDPPVAPNIYEHSAVLPRLGGAMNFAFGKNTYLDLSLLITRFSTVFFIAPYIGYGISF